MQVLTLFLRNFSSINLSYFDKLVFDFSVFFFFRKAGAVGSRLTGAGWGGCTVSLVPSDVLDDFIKQVHDGYYAADPERLKRVSESLFATQPGSGAAILKLN